MQKKTISMIMILAMLIALLPPLTTPVSANGMTTIDETLILTNATPTNTSRYASEGWSWDLPSKTLTLAGANIIVEKYSGIELRASGVRIVLEEDTTNSIQVNSKDEFGTEDGILARHGDLTIEGGGTLNINKGPGDRDGSYGINVSEGDLTIAGNVTLNVNGGPAKRQSAGIYAKVGRININGGTINTTGDSIDNSCTYDCWSAGMYASDSITVNGGTVTAGGKSTETPNMNVGETTVAHNYGMYSHMGNITIYDGVVNGIGFADGEYPPFLKAKDKIFAGIYAASGEINIFGGIVSARSSNATDLQAHGYGMYAFGALNISGGTVTITGGSKARLHVEGEQYLPYGIYANDTLTVSGGDVTVRGSDSEVDSYGIYAEKAFGVSGGKLNVLGGAVRGSGSVNSYAIYAKDSFNVTNGNVTAIGGPSWNGSYAIYANNLLSVSGGTVLAKGGEVDPITSSDEVSYGIFANESPHLSGGLVIAQSGWSTTHSNALSRQPTLDQMELLTGAEDDTFAVYGSTDTYYVMDTSKGNLSGGTAGLDPHDIPVDANGHIQWEEATQTLSLNNVIVNVDATDITGDTNGIGGDISLIRFEGMNVVRSGNTSSDAHSSHGIYSTSDLTIEQVPDTTSELFTIGGTAEAVASFEFISLSSGIWVDGDIDIVGSTITAIGDTARDSYGIKGSFIWEEGSEDNGLTFTDSEITVISPGEGITGRTININNGTTTVVSIDNGMNKQYLNIAKGNGVIINNTNNLITYFQEIPTDSETEFIYLYRDMIDNRYNHALMWGEILPSQYSPQPLTFTDVEGGSVTRTYGDPDFTLTATPTVADGGPISYSSSDETVATVNASTGEVAMHKAGHATITATAAMVPETYMTTTADYILTVNPKPLIWASEGTAHDKEYNGSQHTTVDQSPTLSGLINGDEVTVKKGLVYFADKNAGTDKTIMAGNWGIEGADASNYTAPTVQPTFGTANITKLQLTANVNEPSRQYNGTSDVSVNLSLSPTNKIGNDDVSLTATGTMADASVGTNKHVTISNIQMTGTDAGNYIAPVINETWANITKAFKGISAISPVKIQINSADTSDKTLELPATLMPVSAADAGAMTYTLGSLTNLNDVLDGAPALGGTTLTYKGKGQSSGTATQDIIIQSDNYTDFTAEIVFEATGKQPTTVTVIPPADIVYGQDLGDPSASTSDTVADEQYTFTYSGMSLAGNNHQTFYLPDTKPSKSGHYTVTATLNSVDYVGSDSASFSISKAKPIGTPTYTEIHESGKTLADTNISGQDRFTNPFNSNFSAVGTVSWDDGDSTAVTQDTSYGWTFTPYDIYNYTVVTGSIIPWPDHSPSQTLTFDDVTNGTVTKTYGDPAFALTATRAEADGGTITYQSSDDTVATVDASTGEVTMHKTGQATITAIAARVPETYSRTTANYILTVNPKVLTWNHDGMVDDKPYDGTDTATIDQLPTLSGIINSDTVTVTAGNVRFADAAAGAGKSIIAENWWIEGADANNYTAPTAQPTFSSADITKLQLTAAATAIDREYDGTTAVTVTLTPTNKVGSDQVSLTATGKMADADVGTNKPVTISNIQMSGSAANNYIAPSNLNTTVNITKASSEFTATTPFKILISSADTNDHTLELPTTLNPTGTHDPGTITFTLAQFTNADSVIDGNPTLNGTTLTYKGNGQIEGTATQEVRIESEKYEDIFAEIHFEATDKKVTAVTVIPPADITYGQMLGDPSANTSVAVTEAVYAYSYSGILTSGTAYGPSETKPTDAGYHTVTATVTSAVYYGSDSASFTIFKATPTGTPTYTEIKGSGNKLADTNMTGEFTNPFNSDAVLGQITWDDGADTTVTQATYYHWTFMPNDTDNYHVVTGSITPWPADLPLQNLTFNDVTNDAVTKTYGDPVFALTATHGVANGGPITYHSSDEAIATVDVSTGEVSMHKAGQAAITATAAEVPGMYGESRAMYELTVNPKELSWKFDGKVKDKPYDGTDTATVDQAPTLTGMINGDAVTVTTGEVSFADATAGTDKTIQASGWGIAGEDANNYTAPTAQPAFQSAEITKLQLTATATATDRAYDGTTGVTVTVTSTNKVGSDQIVLTGIGTMADADAGTNKPVIISNIQLSGSDVDNYLAPVNVETTVNISKANAIDEDTGMDHFTATSPVEITIHSTNTIEHTLELSTTLNPIGSNDPGAITFALDQLTNLDSVLGGSPTLNGTILTYKGNGKPSGTATQVIKIESENYEAINASIIFEATDKTATKVTVTPPTNITYGQILGNPSASASDKVTDESYMFSYSGTLTSGTPYGPSATKPTHAGSYTVTATLNSAVYVGSDQASFTISKATPAGAPTYTEISESGKTLADASITGQFMNPNNSDAVAGQFTWDDGDSTTVVRATSYNWTFTPNDTDNYHVVTGSINPWPAPPGGEISGELSMTGTPQYGYVLKGIVNLTGNPWGNLTYTWKRGTTVLQTSTMTENTDNYTVQSGDIGSALTLEVTSDYYSGKLTASTMVAVTKRKVKEPSPPIVAGKTKSSITLRAASGYEYTIDNGNTWQDSPVFTDLTPGTTYTFKQRIKETPTSFASAISGAAEGTTLDKDQLQQPDNLRWDTTGTEVLAKWDDVPNHAGFTVQLYKDGVPVGQPIDIYETFYDFSAAIEAGGEGIYTFSVVAKGDNVSYIDSLKSRVATAYVKKNTRNVRGTVEDENDNPVNNAEVRVMQGNTQIGITVMTALDGTFTVTGIPAGSYNLVITQGDQRVTRYFSIGDTDYIFEEVITLPSGKKNSVLEVSQDTPDVVVDKLDEMFNQPEIYTPEDDATVANGGKVEIKLAVEKNDNAANVSDIKNTAKSNNFTLGTVLDLNVTKTATDNLGALTAFTPITDTQVLLTIVIPIPEDEQGKSEYKLIRAHDYDDGNGIVTEYIGTTANANGEKIEVNADKSVITAYVRFFSTYAIAYPDGSQTGSGSGGGSGSGSNDNSDDSSNEGSSEPAANTIVFVDGIEKLIGREEVEETITTSIPDSNMLEAEIEAAAKSIVVPISENKEVKAQLVVQNVEDMKAKGMTFTVQTGNISYNIDTTAINIEEIRTALGKDADPSKMPFVITIKDVGDEVAVPDIAEENVVVKPIRFTISATYNGETFEVEKFESYINRTIEVTKEQADRITTAIVVEPDGTLRHVPTEVYTQDGKHYAKINSLTNSVYTLIYNEQQFDDVIGTWVQEQADEMTSRKILYGVSEGVFYGERHITRAEFAAMIVRALGLPANGISTFNDVPEDAWYSGAVATAADYGIVVGVGDNLFAPLTNITRQEAMAILYNASKLTPYVDQGIDNDVIAAFSDYGTQSDWANSAVVFNLSNQFIVGYEGEIRPLDYITRSETASVILRLLQKAELVDVRSHP